MLTLRNNPVGLYVDRSNQQWIVRDPEGNFWMLPAIEDAWEHRQPYCLEEDADLEPVPGHYRFMLNLPF